MIIYKLEKTECSDSEWQVNEKPYFYRNFYIVSYCNDEIITLGGGDSI